MIIRNAHVFCTERRTFEEVELLLGEGRILGLGAPGSFTDDHVLDAEGAYLVPGLVDVHTHGRGGYDFVTCSDEGFSVMARDYAAHGVTTVMPTLATAPYEVMLSVTERLNRYRPEDGAASFCGVHWEGRYIHPDKRGAHAIELLAKPKAEELNQDILRACAHLHISAALELDPDGSFCRDALGMGATLGLAHTTATYGQAKRAEERGITSYTHLFNCMPPLHHRDGGAVCAALEGDCIAELICDGIHVSEEMIRLVASAKGVKGISLISDSMEAAGCADGSYAIGGLPVTVKDGIARTHPDGALAGSTLCLDEALRRFMRFCRMPLCEAILSATKTPAQQMGVYDLCGSLNEGKRADILFLPSPDCFEIGQIMVRGQLLTTENGKYPHKEKNR